MEINTLYDYIKLQNKGEEITVWDNTYDIETYFYNDDDPNDKWDCAMNRLAKLLKITMIQPNGVTVDLTGLIESHLDQLKGADLFFQNSNIDGIMYDMDIILAGNTTERWLEEFVSVLEK